MSALGELSPGEEEVFSSSGPLLNDSGLAENISNISDLCQNLTFQRFGHAFPVPTDPNIYISLATAHLVLVVGPTLILTPLALYFLIERSPARHRANTVFQWLCALCILGPCTYGFVMDLSLLLDTPLLGRCENRWESSILWFFHSSFLNCYFFLLSSCAICFYVSLHYDEKYFSRCKLNLMLIGVMAIAVAIACACIGAIESRVIVSCQVRGSFCVTFYHSRELVLGIEVLRVVFAQVPLNVIVCVCLCLYYKKVKETVLDFDHNIQGAIFHLFLVLFLDSLLWAVPTTIVHFSSFNGTQRSFIEMLSVYTLQLKFTLFPILALSLNKEVRKVMVSGLCKLCTRNGRDEAAVEGAADARPADGACTVDIPMERLELKAPQ